MTRIPKIAHFYWGNKISGLPFLRYMTIYSFYKLNPDWKLNLYTPKISSENKISSPVVYGKFENYYTELSKIPTLTIQEIDFNDINNASEVHKSDLLRWILLGSVGGIWEDMDIINIKSMNNIVCNNENNKYTQVVFVRYDNEPIKPIGFLLSQTNSPFYKFMETQSRHILTKGNLENPHDNFKLDYQAIGTNIFSRYNPQVLKERFNENAIVIDQKCVYRYIWNQVTSLFNDRENKSVDYLNDPNVIACHWFGGAPVTKEYTENVTLDNYKKYPCTITNFIDYVLNI